MKILILAMKNKLIISRHLLQEKKEDVLEIKEILKILGNDHIQIIPKSKIKKVDNIDDFKCC